MRKKKVLFNVFFSFILQVITILSGFVLPRLIIKIYGSDVNGLINSITSFIAYISILQLGVGSVIKSALYKPLAHDDLLTTNIIIKTTRKFFEKIGVCSVAYLFVLAIIFTKILAVNFDFWYTLSLVLIIGMGTISQFMFGITYQMVLEADQKSYIYSILQIITIVCSTFAAILMIYQGFTIQIAKLTSTVFFVLKPIILNSYCKKKYRISNECAIDNSYIKQRWDGFSQGLAYFIHSKTDVFVLSIMSTFINVSIYSVYSTVVVGLSAIITCVDKAVRAAFGHVLAKNEVSILKHSFAIYTTLIHMFTAICFSTASITILSFVNLYTNGIHDANYIQPTFSILIIFAEMLYCLRMPYNGIIFVAGKFKETKETAFIEAGINIICSVFFVHRFGLIGVAIGTLLAMAYRTIAFVVYLNKEILQLQYYDQIKRYIVTFLSYTIAIILLSKIDIIMTGYLNWLAYALLIMSISAMVVLSINFVLLRNDVKNAFKFLLGKRL